MYFKVTNKSGAAVTNFMTKFNKNIFGIKP